MPPNTKLTHAVCDYLEGQVLAGANALMVFDTWGGILSGPCFQAFSCDYMEKIVTHLHDRCPGIPIILFTKGGGLWLDRIKATGCDALSVDWTCDLQAARVKLAGLAALQGNLDPAILLTSPDCIRTHVRQVLAAYGSGCGHVFNLGHGITPDVPVQHVSVLVEAVHEFSPIYHKIAS